MSYEQIKDLPPPEFKRLCGVHIATSGRMVEVLKPELVRTGKMRSLFVIDDTRYCCLVAASTIQSELSLPSSQLYFGTVPTPLLNLQQSLKLKHPAREDYLNLLNFHPSARKYLG